MLTIALSKGRMQDDALALFARAGHLVAENELNSRKLVVSTTDGRYNFVLVKPGDAPTYVEYGVADAGVCGRDVLMESRADVHEPLDLKFGRCKIAVAGKREVLARITTCWPPFESGPNTLASPPITSTRKACRSRSSRCRVRSNWPRCWAYPTASSIWSKPGKRSKRTDSK